MRTKFIPDSRKQAVQFVTLHRVTECAKRSRQCTLRYSWSKQRRREGEGGGWLSRKILDEWKPTAAVINGGNHNCVARFENKELFAAMKLYLEKNPSAYKFLFNFETNATKRTTNYFFFFRETFRNYWHEERCWIHFLEFFYKITYSTQGTSENVYDTMRKEATPTNNSTFQEIDEAKKLPTTKMVIITLLSKHSFFSRIDHHIVKEKEKRWTVL